MSDLLNEDLRTIEPSPPTILRAVRPRYGDYLPAGAKWYAVYRRDSEAPEIVRAEPLCAADMAELNRCFRSLREGDDLPLRLDHVMRRYYDRYWLMCVSSSGWRLFVVKRLTRYFLSEIPGSRARHVFGDEVRGAKPYDEPVLNFHRTLDGEIGDRDSVEDNYVTSISRLRNRWGRLGGFFFSILSRVGAAEYPICRLDELGRRLHSAISQFQVIEGVSAENLFIYSRDRRSWRNLADRLQSEARGVKHSENRFAPFGLWLFPASTVSRNSICLGDSEGGSRVYFEKGVYYRGWGNTPGPFLVLGTIAESVYMPNTFVLSKAFASPIFSENEPVLLDSHNERRTAELVFAFAKVAGLVVKRPLWGVPVGEQTAYPDFTLSRAGYIGFIEVLGSPEPQYLDGKRRDAALLAQVGPYHAVDAYACSSSRSWNGELRRLMEFLGMCGRDFVAPA